MERNYNYNITLSYEELDLIIETISDDLHTNDKMYESSQLAEHKNQLVELHAKLRDAIRLCNKN